MAKKFLVSLDLSKNELLNARVQNLGSDPSSPVAGQVYFNTGTSKLRSFNGSTWDEYGTSTANGTVTTVSVVSANGFAGTVANASSTPAITLTTSITGMLKGNGTALQAATAGTDYSAGTAALATGILKSTTTTGALSIAVAGDFPTLNQNTTGSAATLTTARSIYGNTFNGSADVTGIIGAAFGGTGNGFTAFTGPAATTKTFTLPNASATILTDNAAVTVAQGGTGRATATTAYGLIAAGTTATGAQQTIAPGTSGHFLVSAGASALAGFRAIAAGDIPTLNQNTTGTAANVTGTVAVANGGTGATTAAAARTALGLVIGTDVLAPNGSGASLTGITQSQVANLVTDLAGKAPLASPTFTGTVTVPTPTNDTDAANKLYVDNAVQGLSWKSEVQAATTGNVTLAGSAPNTVDGVTLALNDRVLVRAQTAGAENGIYRVATLGTGANGTWTRATDADSASELDGATVYVEGGTTYADTVWSLTTDTITLGTTTLTFAQINGGATPVASTTTQGKVELATQAEAEAKADSTLAVTPASLATFARKFTGLIGDGAATSIAVTHGLGSQYVTAQVFDAATNAMVECDITLSSGTQTTFIFATAPAANAYRVVITG